MFVYKIIKNVIMSGVWVVHQILMDTKAYFGQKVYKTVATDFRNLKPNFGFCFFGNEL